MSRPTHRAGDRLSEDQKRTVICPVCHAGIGSPCKIVSKTGQIVGGAMVKSHDKRKAMAAYKLSRRRALEVAR